MGPYFDSFIFLFLCKYYLSFILQFFKTYKSKWYSSSTSSTTSDSESVNLALITAKVNYKRKNEPIKTKTLSY